MRHIHAAKIRPDFAGLRHQLLTPLNHIIGYSEMLLEDSIEEASSEGFNTLQQNLTRVRETAKDLVRLVHTSLSPRPGKRGDKLLAELRFELAPPLHSILQSVGAITSEYGDDLNIVDVLKIGRAATELLGFAQGSVKDREPVTAHRHRAAVKRAPAAPPARILAVDDNKTNRELLARQLKRQGHQVYEAASGPEALAMMVEARYDIVLLDMLMPKLDGFQVLERIKADPALAETPVIVVSALNEIPGVVRCIETGAEDYLFKPVDPVLLASRIRSSLERRRLHDLEKQRAADLEKAYRDLHLGEERLRLALSADRASIWECDLATNRVSYAEEPGKPHEYEFEQMVARIHPSDRESIRKRLLDAVEQRKQFHAEFRIIRPGGEAAWIESVAMLHEGEGGRAARMIGIARNISARKQVEAALHRSNQDFQRFALAASHDLREPLRRVSSELRGLLDSSIDDQSKKTVASARETLGRMCKLTSDLLDYSQVGWRHGCQAPASSEAVLARVTEDLRLTIEEAGAVITHGKLPPVSADFNMLHRVFQNLIANSLKYRGSAPPRIHISAKRQEERWLFRFSDNGIGIDPKYSQSIFGPFQRLHGRDVPGSGLGLAICQRIIEQSGGRIWMESAPGKGSKFFFTLPGAAEAKKGAARIH
ncbi:MAG: response regulator [Bryobacteraceae bacterium]